MISTRFVACTMLSCLALTASFATQAGGIKAAPHAQMQMECGSCHVPYPPQLLPAAAWSKLMEELDKHFGSDASLDAPTRNAIEKHLLANASPKDRPDKAGQMTLRITETAWYQRKHHELAPAVWKRPSVKSASNCGACHREAADQGVFDEDTVRVPKN